MRPRSQPSVEAVTGKASIQPDRRFPSIEARIWEPPSGLRTFPGPWGVLADVEVFVDEVLAELEAMAKKGARPVRSGPKP